MKKGFTFIELIIVIVVLGILSAFAITKYVSMSKDAELSVAKSLGGALKSAATLYLTRMALDGSSDPKPDRFSSFVGYTQGSSDMNFICIDNSIRSLLADPNAMVGTDSYTIRLEFKSGATAVYSYDPATGRIAESFTGF